MKNPTDWQHFLGENRGTLAAGMIRVDGEVARVAQVHHVEDVGAQREVGGELDEEHGEAHHPHQPVDPGVQPVRNSNLGLKDKLLQNGQKVLGSVFRQNLNIAG